MKTISQSIGLLLEAMFLQPEPYAAMRDRDNAAVKGLLILIILGLIVALASFIGSSLTWAASPDIAAVQETVLAHLQQMSWWENVEADSVGEMIWFMIWDSMWQFQRLLNPTPVASLAGFIVTPLGLVAFWIVFGLTAHVIAQVFGGQGSLGQTLGTTSLASAPQLLGLFNVFPFVTLAGIAMWTLLARYVAVRVAHNLSWGRAFWVTILAMFVVFLLLAVLAGAGMFAVASTALPEFVGA